MWRGGFFGGGGREGGREGVVNCSPTASPSSWLHQQKRKKKWESFGTCDGIVVVTADVTDPADTAAPGG